MAPKVNVLRRTTRANSKRITETIPKNVPKKKVNKPKVTKKTPPTRPDPVNEEEEEVEETVTMTRDELDAMVAEQVAEIVAIEASKESGKKTSSQAKGKSTAIVRTTGGSSSKGSLFKDFSYCKPINFQGTEGAVGLLQWFEKTESVFRLCDCLDENRVKFATGTFTGTALSWWTSHSTIVGIDAANNTEWEEFKDLMRREYCSRGEIQKLEVEFWNLVVKGNDIAAYTRRFHELSVLCPNMVTPWYKRIERYNWGLPQSIQGNVMSSKPGNLSEAVRLAHDLMSEIIRHEPTTKPIEIRSSDNKRKLDGNQERSYEQQPYKEPEAIKGYYVGQSSNLSYLGNKPFCNICKRHHPGPCTMKLCEKCWKMGHLTKDCRAVAPGANNSCFNCGEKGHFRRNCPLLIDQETEREHEEV